MEETRKDAEKLFKEAYAYHMIGELDKAIELYEQSIDIYPTAEAYTFLGWAYSMKGDYEKAIELCKEAIDIDPEFGNPYNDIGAYLIELGREEEAIPWLKLALTAKRYDSKHFPYLNLARVYLKKGDYYEALKFAEEALKISKDYKPAAVIRHQILAMLN